MSDDAIIKTTPRRNIEPICVWVNEEEREAIIANAKACGLSASAYARNLALGHSPPTILDLKEVGNLMATRADLGRLGGLFKMWLSDMVRYNQIYDQPVDELLAKISEAQDKLLAVIHRIDREARAKR